LAISRPKLNAAEEVEKYGLDDRNDSGNILV